MTPSRPLPLWLWVVAAAAGASLGYFQDDLTQRLASLFVPPVAEAFLVAGSGGWVAFTLWYAAALKLPRLRLSGKEPSRSGLFALLLLFSFTVAGGIAFFLLNGMDYMTLSQVAIYATLMAAVYNFALVVLPLVALDRVRAALFSEPTTPWRPDA